MKTIQLDLPDDLARDLEGAASAGAFADTADLIRGALSEFIIRSRDTTPAAGETAAAYARRAELIENAWRKRSANDSKLASLKLSALVAAMKQSSATATPSTSMYFAGADVDHPYFLQSDALGFGIAVLPEDAAKAKLRKRHPHQVEVIFVLEGALTLHIEDSAPAVLQKGDHYVIPKNVCHWITPHENKAGAFAFVKTNPAQEPRGVSCD
jgi:mannose-6-phosphate isomerase-like protein (cupin superfamily)